ncbi:hypothetical protein PR003_g18289 [Phytophthora rubi]|uniref:Uncharacterized protein n=1 Tax=Phytophthora rubi TaxID=129364 RepID=A0A6A4E1V5_9STRA|nr:hypothetical protein PR003_g18289 [Phytophthora rubi]
MDDDAARSLQQVVPLCDRVRCTDWMELDQALRGSKGLNGRTVDFFPSIFRSSDRRVNLNKARDWWKKREETAASLEDAAQLKFATSRQHIRHQFVVKTLRGRGTKLGEHWAWLYRLLLTEFQRLHRAGVKLSNQLVAEMDVVFIEDSEYPRFNARLTVKGKPFTSMLTPRRIQDFLERYNIVYRRHKGKKQVSLEMQMQIDKDVAKHMGELKRQFEDGTLIPDEQYNMDESHFVIDLDDGKTLDFVGAQSVKYRSIVSEREGSFIVPTRKLPISSAS